MIKVANMIVIAICFIGTIATTLIITAMVYSGYCFPHRQHRFRILVAEDARLMRARTRHELRGVALLDVMSASGLITRYSSLTEPGQGNSCHQTPTCFVTAAAQRHQKWCHHLVSSISVNSTGVTLCLHATRLQAASLGGRRDTSKEVLSRCLQAEAECCTRTLRKSARCYHESVGVVTTPQVSVASTTEHWHLAVAAEPVSEPTQHVAVATTSFGPCTLGKLC